MISAIDLLYAGKLKEWRQRMGLKQLAAAQLLDISQQEYSDLEGGKKKFTIALITSIFTGFQLETNNTNHPDFIEMFTVAVYKKLTEPTNEERLLSIIELYYKRETIMQQLENNELELQATWYALTGETLSLRDAPAISFGYLRSERLL